VYRAQRGLVQGMYAGLDAEQVSHLGESLAKARTDLADAGGRLDAARGRAGATAQAAIAPSVSQLRAQQDALTAQMQSMLTRLGPNHPNVVGLRDQLAELQRNVTAETSRVVAALDAEVRADRERVITLGESAAAAQQQLDRNAQSQIPLNAMQRDAEAARTQLQDVLDRIQQTAQQAAIETPDAHEVSLALPPMTPSWPRTGQLLGAAGAFGVLFGLLLVYLEELTDTTLGSSEDVRAAFGLPCFALIPELDKHQIGRLSVADYAIHKTWTPFAEQFRALRAGLWLGADQPHIIAVTAARASEGKTTVTLALGRSAALSGERVVVVDCDTRQPTFARRLRVDAKAGILDCLQERATLEQVLCKDWLTNMAFIQAGTADHDATRSFMSGGMVKLLQELRRDYDLVLLDAPPVQAMTDTRVVAQLADATLLCVRWRHTARAAVQNALDLLQEVHASVAGIALTRVDARVHLRSGSADADVYHARRAAAKQDSLA
jgi:polysaccharide biosynthesis transport protein